LRPNFSPAVAVDPSALPAVAHLNLGDTSRYRWCYAGSVIPSEYETQSDTLKEILSELFALLEAKKLIAPLFWQLLKDQGIASDENYQLTWPSRQSSNVKWRAARMRMECLLTPIQKKRQTKTIQTSGTQRSANPKKRNSGSR